MKPALALAAFALFSLALPPRPAALADAAPCPIALKGGKAGRACQLHGKVKFVSAFADYKVQMVDAFPDVKVQMVSAFPDQPGQWQVVDAFPDFTVQVVSAFPDFKVQVVSAFPGCP